jgi:hypothetical protein
MNKTKKTVVLVVVIISVLIVVSIFIIIISKILETNAKKKLLKPFPRPRITGTVCKPSSFVLLEGSIRLRNGCFQDLFVFVNPFENNKLILSKTYTVFQYNKDKSIYRYNGLTDKEEYINSDKDNLLYMDTNYNSWIIVPTYRVIVGTTKKWTIIERKDKNGFLVWTLTLIDKLIQDPVSSAWIIEKI